MLAEREHIAGLAQRSTVRRHGMDARPAALFDVLADKLIPLGVDAEELGWDSWRRDDGRWMVQVAYCLDEITVVARFVYDPRARSVLPEDDEARWLTGEIEHRTPAEPRLVEVEVEDRAPARKKLNERPERLTPSVAVISSVGDLMEAPVRSGPAAVEKSAQEPAAIAAAMRSVAAAAERPAEPVAPRRSLDSPRRPAVAQRRPAVAMDVQLPVAFPEPMTPTPAAPVAPPQAPPDVVAESETETVVARTGTDGETTRPTRRGRASVPAWDDIMFGARRTD